MICKVNVEFHNDVLFLQYLANELLLKLRGTAFVCEMFSCFQNELTGSVLQHKVESQSGLPSVVKHAGNCTAPGGATSGGVHVTVPPGRVQLQQPGSELRFNGPQIRLTLHISFPLYIRFFPSGAFGKTLRFRLRLLYFSSEKD